MEKTNWIKGIINYFKPQQAKKKGLTLDEARKVFCEYTENPFSTDFRNFMQRVKVAESPTGWGAKKLDTEEIKRRLDNGICWIDYPALNEDGTEIEGVTGKNFGS